MLEPSRADEALGADVVIGVPAARDRAAAAEAAVAVQAGLRAAFPGRSALALVLAGDAEGTLPQGAAIAIPEPGAPAPAIHTGGGASPEAALHTLLDVALSLAAPACALLEPMPRPADPGWLRALLDPILAGDADLVAPSYARRRFDGVLVTGLVYPLTRALFGQRIRQPLGRELAMSRRLAEHLSGDVEWRTDPSHAGADLWVITKALVRECRCAQVFLGPRTVPLVQPPDVSDALANVLGTMFHEMVLHAPRWQRVRGSCPVATHGEEHLPDDAAHPPAPGPLVAAFGLGAQDLRRVWGPVLPPQALYALQRIAREPPEGFRMPDPLWARIVYDFAVGWRVKTLDRQQLLRSLTPLYLGWVASYVNEVAPLDPPAADERLERLCEVFEAEKPYLISRWRWPDRFAP
ncbi:MAG TPA: hypothetical protein VF894_15615 [Anaeromyxobacter sp.]